MGVDIQTSYTDACEGEKVILLSIARIKDNSTLELENETLRKELRTEKQDEARVVVLNSHNQQLQRFLIASLPFPFLSHWSLLLL